MIEFFTENWHLVLFGGISLGTLVWELLHKQGLKIERMLRVLVILVSSYGVAWVTQQIRDNEQRNTDYLIKVTKDKLSLVADNEYARTLLDELDQRLVKFHNYYSEAEMESDVRSQLIRALRSARRTAWFIDHYVLLWSESGNPELNENLIALRRGVEVRRTFVLSESLLLNQPDLDTALKVMENQKKAGIKVSFVLQRDLQRYKEYQRHADVNYGVFDNKLLAKVSARASARAGPTYCLLSWNPSVVSEESPQVWLEGTGAVRDYTDNSRSAVLLAAREKR